MVKKKNLRFGKKNILVAAKQVSRSAMPNKLFFIFGLTNHEYFCNTVRQSFKQFKPHV